MYMISDVICSTRYVYIYIHVARATKYIADSARAAQRLMEESLYLTICFGYASVIECSKM